MKNIEYSSTTLEVGRVPGTWYLLFYDCHHLLQVVVVVVRYDMHMSKIETAAAT